MIDSFHIAVAFAPIAVYFLLMAWIRWIRRPLVVSGGRDIAALAIGLSGCVAVGPMELFFPRAAATLLGPRVWFLLALLYLLCVLMTILASKPRLVVYGLSREELDEHLHQALYELDNGTQWMGEHVQSPGLGLNAIVEKAGPGRVSQIVAVSHRQDARGWIMLERAMMARMHNVQIDTRTVGGLYFTLGAVLLALAALALTHDPVATAESMQQMLRY